MRHSTYLKLTLFTSVQYVYIKPSVNRRHGLWLWCKAVLYCPSRPWNCLFFCCHFYVKLKGITSPCCTARPPHVSAKKRTPHRFPEILNQRATVFVLVIWIWKSEKGFSLLKLWIIFPPCSSYWLRFIPQHQLHGETADNVIKWWYINCSCVMYVVCFQIHEPLNEIPRNAWKQS